MLPRREVEVRRLAPAAQLDVRALVGAIGHVVGEHVRNLGNTGLELGRELPHPLLTGLDLVLERSDLRHDRGCLGTLGAQPADFLGQRVTPGLRLLQLGLQCAHGATARRKLGCHGRQTASPQGAVQGLRPIAQPFQVEHGKLRSDIIAIAGVAVAGLPAGVEFRARRGTLGRRLGSFRLRAPLFDPSHGDD